MELLSSSSSLCSPHSFFVPKHKVSPSSWFKPPAKVKPSTKIYSSSTSTMRGSSPSPITIIKNNSETQARGEADPMGLLLKERIVFLGSNIDDFVADAIISQLLLLDALDPTKDIRLFINSPGGALSLGKGLGLEKAVRLTSYDQSFMEEDFDNLLKKGILMVDCATMAIYDVVKLVRADVSTVALGIAASTASIILGGGTKGKRLAMPNTRIMIHQPLGGASGQAIDVEIQAQEVMHNKNNVTRIFSESTGRSFEQVQKDIDRDRYMSPIEAVEYGIIDGVIDRDSIIPLVPVPDKVKSRVNFEEMSKDPRKFLTPEVPDDEIF
uniref:ATP-dependent Clp protease proteolytic subunit n=1 Tax=Quercus lobata TaxID=97700 RepID=A0A7N2N3K0_QUELO